LLELDSSKVLDEETFLDEEDTPDEEIIDEDETLEEEFVSLALDSVSAYESTLLEDSSKLEELSSSSAALEIS
jgi:hypothetical protein